VKEDQLIDEYWGQNVKWVGKEAREGHFSREEFLAHRDRIEAFVARMGEDLNQDAVFVLAFDSDSFLIELAHTIHEAVLSRDSGPAGPVAGNSPTVLAPACARLHSALRAYSAARGWRRCAPRRGAPRSRRHPPALRE